MSDLGNSSVKAEMVTALPAALRGKVECEVPDTSFRTALDAHEHVLEFTDKFVGS